MPPEKAGLHPTCRTRSGLSSCFERPPSITEHMLGHSACRASCLLGGDVDGLEDFARVRKEDLTGGQELHSARSSAEEGGAELVFEAADLAAHRRLGDAEPLRGAPDVPLLGDGHEVPELGEAHGS